MSSESTDFSCSFNVTLKILRLPFDPATARYVSKNVSLMMVYEKKKMGRLHDCMADDFETTH